MNITEKLIRETAAKSTNRYEFWSRFLNTLTAKRVVELGVFRGDYAARILKDCESIETYYMLDPWRHLDDWEKPANKDDDTFQKYLQETKDKTEFAGSKRVFLQGKTTEVIDQIKDHELDFAYIDGDHTLKGICIDLIRVYAKIRDGGWIGGDDLSKTIWQHSTAFEPTLIFPFAVYFAEAVNARIYALPNAQFLIEKNASQGFSFIDLTGDYKNVTLRSQLNPRTIFKMQASESFPKLWSYIVKIKRALVR